MSSPSKTLKTAREKSGKLPEEIASLVDLGKDKYYDLESDDDEVEINTAIGELRDICAVLKIPIQSLFGASVNPSDRVSPEDLVDRIKNHLQQTKTNIEAFEDRVDFTIRSCLENPSDVRNWNIECLRAVCGEIGVNWIHAL